MVCTTLPHGPHIMGVVKWFEEDAENPLLSTGIPELDKPSPGDRRMSSPTGNTVATLGNGINIIKSAGQAQIITRPDNHVDMLTGTYKHQSSFGEVEISRSEGSVSYSIRGGSSVKAHTGIGKVDAWTLRIDAGAKGDTLNVRVTTPEDKDLARFHMKSDGRLDIFSSGGRTELIQAGDTKIVEGASSTVVTGNVTLEASGTHTLRADKFVHQVIGSETHQVGGNQLLTVSDTRRVLVDGDEIKHVRGAAYQEVYDEYQRIVAPSQGGGIPTGQAMSWVNYGGGFNFVLQPTAAGSSFSVVSSLPASVHLGVDGLAAPDPLTGRHTIKSIPGTFGAVLYEPLASFLGNLMTWLDTHVHPTAAVGPPSPPVVPSSPILLPTLPTARSLRVTLGA